MSLKFGEVQYIPYILPVVNNRIKQCSKDCSGRMLNTVEKYHDSSSLRHTHSTIRSIKCWQSSSYKHPERLKITNIDSSFYARQFIKK